jgi:hypothetical protein
MCTNSPLRFAFLTSLLAFLAVPAAGDASSGQTTLPLCFGKSATIVGDADDTYIKGTRGDDVILVRRTRRGRRRQARRRPDLRPRLERRPQRWPR